MKRVMACLLLGTIFGVAEMGYAAHPQTGEPIESVYILIGDVNARFQDEDKAKFRMNVFINGTSREDMVGVFVVSPGKLIDNPEKGKEPELTPEGVFHPTRLEERYVSKQFGGRVLGIFETGSMPNSIFFHQGFAMHGSYGEVSGKPASKGCVRMKVGDSKKLFSWVSEAINRRGNKSVTIRIMDTESNYVARYRAD